MTDKIQKRSKLLVKLFELETECHDADLRAQTAGINIEHRSRVEIRAALAALRAAQRSMADALDNAIKTGGHA